METRRGCALALAGWFLLGAGSVSGQTLSNPDIGVIGDMRVIARGSKAADSLGVNSPEFEFHELEFAFNAHVNPWMRADVFLGLHDGEDGIELDIEEANLTVLRGLPLSLQLNAGIFLLDFGRLNTQHPHQWGWLDRPLVARELLGEEGLSATGIRLNTLLAAGDNAIGLSATAFSSDGFKGHEHEADDSAEEDAPAEILGSGRVSVFRQLGEAWSAEIGLSAMAGDYDPAENLSLTQGAVDWKLRWRPDSYRSLSWIAEVMSGRRDVADEIAGTVQEVDATGAFTSLELQWRKRWSAGPFFDWSEDAQVAGAETTAFGVFAGFSPAEETARIGLAYRHETSDLTGFDDNSLTLQFLWALGPHKVHTF